MVELGTITARDCVGMPVDWQSDRAKQFFIEGLASADTAIVDRRLAYQISLALLRAHAAGRKAALADVRSILGGQPWLK